MREAMRSLAQGIVASYEARAAGLASIRQDVSAHRESARRHVQALEGTRRGASGTLHSHLAREHAKFARNEGRRKSGVRRWLADVASTGTRHAAVARAGLAEASAKSRGEAQASLKNFASARRVTARHLKEDLAQGHARLRASVITQLQELDEVHEAMAHGQRDDLMQGRADLAQADAQRRSGVLSWLGELTGDRLAAGQEWQDLVATMGAKRSGGVAVAEAPPAAPVKVAPKKEKAVAKQERFFSYLANRPDGTRLVEFEREFGLDRFRAAQVIKRLMNEGKAEKRDRLYFAA